GFMPVHFFEVIERHSRGHRELFTVQYIKSAAKDALNLLVKNPNNLATEAFLQWQENRPKYQVLIENKRLEDKARDLGTTIELVKEKERKEQELKEQEWQKKLAEIRANFQGKKR
ncbi:hypothetical protein, partial [Phormidium sp. CCY1219]|uniref:hypothetical protein n=1 Tax=Phormidium sp. CCY1219 TaxID=2886104 RepID=UPI002D1F324A